ncbi:hypothetical protein DUNSADRAFT_5488 [Dunaliella salina]|uniref:FAD-binding FR-type domain-containing protein n=1 Tax=Dunaliella salina TaxID=3046 RepID=A0ABQ7H798_DUNSA|nr:hypothetical protein DUNSADRAFT_5488 [Dunaliella salina]|eukprot:KAF5842721.1 hypothetical protein DUNSADRAFT_5488 [Dunaliella salina]
MRAKTMNYAAMGSQPSPINAGMVPSCSGRCNSRPVASSSRPHVLMMGGGKKQAGMRHRMSVSTSAVSDEEDLIQFPERMRWYETKFCADDAPDWNSATFLRSEDVAPGLRNVVVLAEVSRERVPLRNAYKSPGQKATVRLIDGQEYQLAVSSPPPSQFLNKKPLFIARGDLFAYEVKSASGPKEPTSVQAEVHMLVGEREAPDIFKLQEENTPVEVGPFLGNGLDFKGSGILAIFRFPTLVMFVSGKGIATARALLEATDESYGLNLASRKQVKVYYKTPNEASACYRDLYPKWSALAAEPHGCDLDVVQTRQSFGRAFDDDDTLAYSPEYTAAIILTGGDPEEEAEAREVCKEAEITTICADSEEAAELKHLDSTASNFKRYMGNK